MNVIEALRHTDQMLESIGCPHALIDGMALSEYGYGQATQDVDWLIPESFVKAVILASAHLSSESGLKVVRLEDLIGLKIQAYSNQPKRKIRDLADIQEIIERNPMLDWSQVQKYAEMFHEWDEIKKLRSSE